MRIKNDNFYFNIFCDFHYEFQFSVNKFSTILNIYDIPNERKLHEKKLHMQESDMYRYYNLPQRGYLFLQ